MHLGAAVGDVICFDFGSKRIGVAIASASQPPTPLTTVDASADVWSQINHLLSKHKPGVVVVGWPRGLDGQHTAQTHMAEEFARELEARYGTKVVMQDEALSSEEASKRLNPKLTVHKQREQIDAVAAQVILEDYIRESH